MQRMYFPRVEMETEDPGTPTLGFALRSSYSNVHGQAAHLREQLVHHLDGWHGDVGEEHPGFFTVVSVSVPTSSAHR
uniref:Uncharacterized protein n=1 Tax=Globodera rostochiensis TaxID=31243 RepID=A0A914H7S1_GLORO